MAAWPDPRAMAHGAMRHDHRLIKELDVKLHLASYIHLHGISDALTLIILLDRPTDFDMRFKHNLAVHGDFHSGTSTLIFSHFILDI